MVLKRLLATSFVALGLSVLVAGPAVAQTQIPPPKLLGTGTDPCTVSKAVLERLGMDPATPLNFGDTALMSCGDAEEDVGDFREAYDDHAAAQRSLSGYLRQANMDGRITTAEEQRIAFLTDVRDKALEAKNEHVGNALADAVYAEADAIAALGQLNRAITGEDGYNDALKTATIEHHNFIYFYEDDNGDAQAAYLAAFDATTQPATDGYERPTSPDLDHDGDGSTPDATLAPTSLVEQLTVARDAWNALSGGDEPYDSDGDLKDFDDLTQTAKDAAVALSVAERRLADAKSAASSEVTALANANAALKAAQNAVKDGEDAVRATMKTLADRAAGAGDNAATRLAQVRNTRQKAYDDAAENLADAQGDLDDAQDELDELQDDLDDAESDLSSAQQAYEDAVEARADVDDGQASDTDDETEANAMVQAAAARLAVADTSAQSLSAKVKAAKADVESAQDDVDDESEVAGKAKKALDEAISGNYEFTEENPAGDLLDALVQQEDTGGALVDAVDAVYQNTASNKEAIDANSAAIEGLDTSAIDENTVAIAENADDIESLDGRVTTNEETLVDHGMKLMQKKEYIDNLGAHIGVDPVTGMGTGENGMSRIDMNEHRSMSNMEAIATNSGRIDANETAIGMNSGRIDANEVNISSNADNIAANMNSIGQNASAISDNRNMIGELSDSLDVVRAGVAASMALAGMPAINGRGVSIGVGSFDGESAFAVGFQIQGEMASFKVGVTSASGATGASAGVGFQF